MESFNCRKCKFSKSWDLGGEWGMECRHPRHLIFSTDYTGLHKSYPEACEINSFGNCDLYTKSKNVFKIVFG